MERAGPSLSQPPFQAGLASASRLTRIERLLLQNDLDSAVLRLAHALGRRHQRVRLAEALDADRGTRHAVADEFVGDVLRPADREALVVACRPGQVGVAVDLD